MANGSCSLEYKIQGKKVEPIRIPVYLRLGVAHCILLVRHLGFGRKFHETIMKYDAFWGEKSVAAQKVSFDGIYDIPSLNSITSRRQARQTASGGGAAGHAGRFPTADPLAELGAGVGPAPGTPLVPHWRQDLQTEVAHLPAPLVCPHSTRNAQPHACRWPSSLQQQRIRCLQTMRNTNTRQNHRSPSSRH